MITYVKPCITQEIAKQLNGDAKVWIVPDAKHNLARQSHPQEYDTKLTEFFKNTLPEPTHSKPSKKTPETVST